MDRRSRTFRSVQDFLSLPPAEIGACLRCFHDWLARCQELQDVARRDGQDPSRLIFPEFTWLQRTEPSAERPSAPYPASTDIRELGLRPSAMHELRTLNLYALEDFTQASEDELRTLPNVGRATVIQIRSYLQALGLDFRESPHPGRRAVERTKMARSLPPQERVLTDASHVSDLGLKPYTVTRCMEKGTDTVGALRALPLREIWLRFGEKTVLEIVETLESVGLELASTPSQLEKWRFSAIRKERLQHPADDAPVSELQPWLGAICDQLEQGGITTVKELRLLAAAGGRKVRGIGRTSWQRVFEHFGMVMPANEVGRALADR